PFAALARQDRPPHHALPRRGGAARRPRGGDARGEDRPRRDAGRADDHGPPDRDPLPPGRRGGARADGRADAPPRRSHRGGRGARRGARGPASEAAVARGGLPRADGGRRGRGRGVSAEAIRIGVRRPARRLFVHQLRSEQLVFWRSREAAFFIFLFPLLLFVLLGSVYSGKIYGVPAAEALLAGLIGYGCANTAFAGLAIQLVIRRENGILKRLRSTPLPPATYVSAVLVSTLIVFALQTVALFLMGRTL